MMKLLITGGFGYIGGRLAQWVNQQRDYEIILGSRQDICAPSWLPNVRACPIRWDSLSNLNEICTNVDAVIHLAGMNAQECTFDPVAALEVNGVATARLLQAAIQQRVKRFIYLSTAQVYGNPPIGVITEKTFPAAVHPYATSHRSGEDVVLAAHYHGEIEGVIIRLSNSYGSPAQLSANCWMLLVNDLCRQVLATRQMVLRSSGVQRRDFVSLTDVCRAIIHLLEVPVDKLDDGLFNVGGCWSPTILEITQRVAERVNVVTGIKPEILRKHSQNHEKAELLDYKITKLLCTGFELSSRENIDQEIDQLVQFCVRHQELFT